jgi:hypothetical protein
MCGMKAYKMDVYKEYGLFDSLGLLGCELTMFAAKKKYRIENIPIRVKSRMDRSKFGGIIASNLKVIMVFIKFLKVYRKKVL